VLVGEIADDQDHVRVLRPDGLGHGLELEPIVLVHALFVAKLENPEPVRFRVAILSAFAAPGRVGGPVDVFHEVGHVLRGFAHVDIGNAQEAGGLAEVEEIENAPAIGGVGVPPTLVGRTTVARSDHLFPTILRSVGHAAAVAQNGDSLVDEPLGNIISDGQTLEPTPIPRLEKSVSDGDDRRLLEPECEPAIRVIRIGSQLELELLPLTAGDSEGRLRVDLFAIAAFQGNEQLRGLGGLDP